ncbi:hypothetical protein [Actinomyces johnsonii]|nr:hypothetical protein [Actinomyces johnsonii]
MVGFRKKSQDSSPGARAAGRGGAGASQRSRGSRTEPASRAGKERRTAARRGYKTPEQMDSRCLTLAESASGVLGRSLDQALGRLPDGPGTSGGQGSSASMGWADAVGASNSAMSQGASPGSVRSAQTGAGQVDTVADIAADIEF